MSETKKGITIAVDGYASCGKSTLAKALAKQLGYAYIDSGAMYRAVTLFFIENEVDYHNPEAVKKALKDIVIAFRNIDGQNNTFLNGENVESKIREMKVSGQVSQVSTISDVRRALVAMQKELGKKSCIVMDGRDIGTVVFPHAELKLFMNADMRTRTERRLAEMRSKGDDSTDFETVMHNLSERDRIDSTREDSPLVQAEGAIEIDNSLLSPDEQFQIALQLAEELINEFAE